MMLRSKLLLAQLPLGLALLLVGAVSLLTVSTLGEHAQRLLHDNYRSVLAAQRMKDAIERLDDAATFDVLGRRDIAEKQIAPNRATFESELKVELENITEPGEEETAQRLKKAWTEYTRSFDRFMAKTSSAAGYFDDLQPRFAAVKDHADLILTLNQDAMVKKSIAAEKVARRLSQLMTAVSLAALVLGFYASGSLTARLLRPLLNLGQVVQRIGEGDLDVRAAILGEDEIAQLAREFNQMTERLSEYRRSSLGELLRAQQAAQAAIDSLPDPVVIFDAAGGVLSLNETAHRVLDLPEDEEPSLARLPPQVRSALESVRDHVLQGKGAYVPKGFEESVHVVAPDGERHFLPRASPLYGEGAGIAGASVVLQDVTRLRRFDELTSKMVATVAHEFRTPLTSLRMAIHLCVEEAAGPITAKQADLLHAAREDCERLQAIVDDLLDLAHLQSGKVELLRTPTAIEPLLRAAVENHAAAAKRQGVSLEAQIVPSLDEVNIDPERINIVVSNLLSNAIRHTHEGGTIRLKATPFDESVRIEVIDTGEGIPYEHQPQVFERFFRVPGVKSGAVGLGLSIAREIVLSHAGEIGVESQPGLGSRFWFTLPVAEKKS
jgi:two-component system, NtrC family, sensor histidine kinase KinB